MTIINPKTTLDFNKEILFGEAGALISAPLIAYIVSLFMETPRIISGSAVIGSIIGASAFWIIMRVYDKKMKGKTGARQLAEDVIYFTPAAFIITLFVYYPSLFFTSKYLLINDGGVLSSVIFSQAIAFTLFLLSVNVYRYLLARLTGKIL